MNIEKIENLITNIVNDEDPERQREYISNNFTDDEICDLFKTFCNVFLQPDCKIHLVLNKEDLLEKQALLTLDNYKTTEKQIGHIIKCLEVKFSIDSKSYDLDKSFKDWITCKKNLYTLYSKILKNITLRYKLEERNKKHMENLRNRVKEEADQNKPLLTILEECENYLNNNNEFLLLSAVYELGKQETLIDLKCKNLDIDRRLTASINKGDTIKKTNKARSKFEDAKAYLDDYFAERLNYNSDTEFYNSLSDTSTSGEAIKKSIQRLLKKDPARDNEYKEFKKKNKLR